MKIEHLHEGRLIKRYKRFLADVELDTGEVVIAHCANTGSMTGLKDEGVRVWLSHNDNPRRKLDWSWELVEIASSTGTAMVSINTSKANALVREGIESGRISELRGVQNILPEFKVDESRLDFLLQMENEQCFVEVKQVTLLGENGRGYFPDAVSARGLKHLGSLEKLVEEGHRAVLMFCVPHTGINSVSPASHIDPAYTEGLRQAHQKGVEVLAYRCDISIQGGSADIGITDALEVIL